MSMSKKTICICLSLLLLISLSFQTQAASTSTNIKIGVVIKSIQQCNYDFSLLKSSGSHSFTNNYGLHSSSCDSSNQKMQQHVKNVFYTTNTEIDTMNDSRIRVFMTVQ